MSVKITQICDDYWEVTVGEALMGHISKNGQGVFGLEAPVKYEYRSNFTVVSSCRQVFGYDCPTLEDAKHRAVKHLEELANLIKAE